MSKRRSHIKRAKVLRGKFHSYEWVRGSHMKAMSWPWCREYWDGMGSRGRHHMTMAQAMRGYYQD